MLAIFMYWAWTVEEFLILGVIVVLSAKLLDGGNDVFRLAAMELPSLQALWLIVMATVTIIIASFFTVDIICSRTNEFLRAQVQ